MSIDNGCYLYKSCDGCTREDCRVNKQKAEIERLTEEQDKFNSGKYNRALESLSKERRLNAELQKQVDELTKENERLSDIEFTQEHCDLYKENEYLKECLVLAKQQAVKDTAKEILYLLHFTPMTKARIEERIKKRYGVEVE